MNKVSDGSDSTTSLIGQRYGPYSTVQPTKSVIFAFDTRMKAAACCAINLEFLSYFFFGKKNTS